MAVEIKVPNVGESISEVTIASWLKENGEYVERDEAIAELESDKATFELSAEQAGKLEIIAEEGEDVQVGDVVCKIDTSAKPPEKDEKETAKAEPDKKEPEEKPEKEETESDTGKTINHPSPSAAKLLDEYNLTTDDVKGTGKDGRITKGDVLKAIEEKGSEKTEKLESKVEAVKEKKTFSRDTKREKMSRLRRTIAGRLVASKNQTAMLTTFNEIDMSAVMDIRKKYKEKFKEKHDIGLGFMSFFAKACCIALDDFPDVNAQIDGNDIIYHDYADISIAVSTPRGLIVPVIRNAESLSMAELERKVIDLATRGRDNKLSLDEMEGGTFTITNGGVFGSLMSTPIINQPQSAILGMHKIEERPMAVNGKVEIKPMMYVALSYDHRIIDGKESVSFLVRVKELLENPGALYTGGDPVKLLLEL